MSPLRPPCKFKLVLPSTEEGKRHCCAEFYRWTDIRTSVIIIIIINSFAYARGLELGGKMWGTSDKSARLSWGEDGDTMGIIARRVRFRRRHRSAGNGELQSTVEEYTRWQGVSVSGPRSRVRALFSLVCGGFKLRPLPRYNGRSSVQPQTAQWCFSPRPRHLYIKIIRSPPLFTTRIHSLSCFVRLLSSINHRSRSFRLNALATSVKFNDLNLITGRRMKNEDDWTRSCLYVGIFVFTLNDAEDDLSSSGCSIVRNAIKRSHRFISSSPGFPVCKVVESKNVPESTIFREVAFLRVVG